MKRQTGNTLAGTIQHFAAVRGLIEKYGPVETWPEVLASLPAGTSTPGSEARCGRCQGAMWLKRPLPNPTAPDLPLSELVPCPDCNPGPAPEPVERRYRDSGIAPAERERCTFERFDLAANPGMRTARDAAMRWAAGEGPPFLALFSEVKGVGKTHLAIAAAQRCIGRGEPALYWPVPSLLDALRATQRPGGRPLDDVRGPAERCPNVVLDDLAADRGTEFADEQLFTVINERWRRGLRTLVTTNQPLERLEERTRSRLVDWQTSVVVACRGRDYREGRA